MTGPDIAAARAALGMTQAEFATALGYSGKRHVRKWERGEAIMPGRTVTALRQLMANKGVSV